MNFNDDGEMGSLQQQTVRNQEDLRSPRRLVFKAPGTGANHRALQGVGVPIGCSTNEDVT